MAEIKTLKNHAFRRLLVALLSVMFVVLLGGYRSHINTTDKKLKERTEPMQDITAALLSQSGSSNDSLIRSTISERESLISGLDLTPSVSNDLRRYITNLYTVAGAFDTAKASLPQTNDREYLFDRGTIDLLHTNSYLSGDVLGLYSGRQTIKDAIRFLSGAAISTINTQKKQMSSHNLSVALASQIGVEVLICTKSYAALEQGRGTVTNMFSGLLESYQRQVAAIDVLTGTDAVLVQCLNNYRDTIADNTAKINEMIPVAGRLLSIATSRNRAYENDPLQCPIGTDLYNDIIMMRAYESDMNILAVQNSLLENALLTGNLTDIREACESASTGSNSINTMLSSLTGEQFMQNTSSGTTSASGSYQQLPEDTQKIIDDIYQNNIQYIQTMQSAQHDRSYNPLQRIQQLFKEFYGNTKEFLR